MHGASATPIAMAVILTMMSAPSAPADGAAELPPLHAFCGTGDMLWNPRADPVDSPEAIEAMFEWMAETYGVRRIYWRGAQDEIWDQHYQHSPVKPLQYDWAIGWKRYLYREIGLGDAAVSAAHERGLEVFAYTGLFEHGVQPDVGIICPYPFEDELRIQHPEWCPVDRWGERRCPGPLCFGYPEVRQALVDRYVGYVTEKGYDGLTFYTYVENVGLRYPDEFGFNEPIVAEFAKLHPGVDLRRDTLTEEQKLDWYRCRGKFVTQFLRELHERLSAAGKALVVILDCKEPDYPQPWWGKPTPGTGMIRMEWEEWVAEGVVDGLWVQLGSTAEQRATLDRVLAVCEGSEVELTVRTSQPFDAGWRPYIGAGVTMLESVTSPRNALRRLSLEPTSAATLTSPDWRLRAQTLQDVADGTLALPASALAPLAEDPHLLVRHRAMRALGKLGDETGMAAVQRALGDEQSCVRIAAALAMGQAGRGAGVTPLLAALERDGHFQMKLACVEALEVIGEAALPVLIEGLRSPAQAVREVCARSLYKVARTGDATQVYAPLREALSSDPDPVVRYWAIEGLVGLRQKMGADQAAALASELRALVTQEASVTVRLQAAWGLGYLSAHLEGQERVECVAALVAMFREYGDGCEREDAAYGWRVAGNALLLTPEGAVYLEQMRAQTQDRWLAWLAYQVVHVPQRSQEMKLVDESEAIRIREQYAPAFPGTRNW